MMIEIKETSLEEALEVHDKISEFINPKYTTEYFEMRLKDKEALIIISFFQGQRAGYMISYDRYGDKSIYCWMAGVISEFRRIGILKAMMDYLEKWAREKGYNKIKIKTRVSRKEMQGYLKKYGFVFMKKEEEKDDRLFFEKEI